MSLEERILRLERQNRQLRIAGFAMAALVSFFILSAAAAQQNQPQRFKVVEAEEFRVVNAKGTATSTWKLDDDQLAELTFGEERKPHARIGRNTNGGYGVEFYLPNGLLATRHASFGFVCYNGEDLAAHLGITRNTQPAEPYLYLQNSRFQCELRSTNEDARLLFYKRLESGTFASNAILSAGTEGGELRFP